VLDRTHISFGSPTDHLILKVDESYGHDFLYNNVTHVERTETSSESLTVTDTDIVYQTGSEFTDDWMISLPKSNTTSDFVWRDGQPGVEQKRVTAFDYYPYGLLKQTIREPN